MLYSARDAGWSSQVARRAHNPEVAGSNPAPATTKALLSGAFCLQGRRDERDFIPLFIPIAEVWSGETLRFRPSVLSLEARRPAKAGARFGIGASDCVSSGATVSGAVEL